MTPAQEAAYALDFNVSRDDLKPEVQAEYDRLLEARREAAHALESNVSRDALKPEVQTEYDRLLETRRARPPASGSGMTVGAQGTVTIWQRGSTVLYADDHGVTVRRSAGPRRVAWAEISRFADGGGYDSQSGNHFWKLVIVLRTGQKVESYPLYGAPAPETVAAVGEMDGWHRIAATPCLQNRARLSDTVAHLGLRPPGASAEIAPGRMLLWSRWWSARLREPATGPRCELLAARWFMVATAVLEQS